ncbi:MAG: hypothetical protein CMH36_01225 [Microbacterium sp.]|uniref:hypothetical protein n=1 Tax=uncultured Microbacterium sp. TaxID=191216 RepID=UPI000C8B6B70|nr:hypothetical protein [Microbacterium sp.]
MKLDDVYITIVSLTTALLASQIPIMMMMPMKPATWRKWRWVAIVTVVSVIVQFIFPNVTHVTGPPIGVAIVFFVALLIYIFTIGRNAARLWGSPRKFTGRRGKGL